MSDARQIAHELVDSLPERQVAGLVDFLRTIVEPLDDEPVTQEDRRRIEESEGYFEERGGKGIPMKDVLTEYGMTPGVDSAVQALRDAPADDEEDTEGEGEAADEARRWLEDHGGKGIPHAGAQLPEPKDPMAMPGHQGEVGGPCPLCGSETVARQSRTTGELYFGCTNFAAGCRFNGSRSH